MLFTPDLGLSVNDFRGHGAESSSAGAELPPGLAAELASGTVWADRLGLRISKLESVLQVTLPAAAIRQGPPVFSACTRPVMGTPFP